MSLRYPFVFVAAAFSAVVLAAGQAPLKQMPLPAAPVGKTYANPVINLNFPDPSLLRVGPLFYIYGTNSRLIYGTNSRLTKHGLEHNMVCASSPDLVHWTMLPDAMPLFWMAPFLPLSRCRRCRDPPAPHS